MNSATAHPILSCDEAKALEAQLLAGDEAREWPAMLAAGRALAEAVLRDFEEIGGFSSAGRVLVLAGKGHNGGDALLAAGELLRRYPEAGVDVLLVYGLAALRPLAARALRQLHHAGGDRVKAVTLRTLAADYALSLDGLFGFQYRPPLDTRAVQALARINALSVQLRAAVDLPSGWASPEAFRADFTYATGVVKTPLLGLSNAGRLRYLDLGFFSDGSTVAAPDQVLTRAVLAPLQGWRDPQTDKRRQGHVFVLGGSRIFPGAVLMTVLAALRSGAGLVTAFVPQTLVATYAAQVPEAMWVGWPETTAGGLALSGQPLLVERWSRATALVIGPGLAREKETVALVARIVSAAKIPVVLDADALLPETLRAVRTPMVLTPHAGEFERIAAGAELRAFARASGAAVVLKGPVTRIAAGDTIYHSFFGGPVLARGGSGDLLAGIVGSQLALTPNDPAGAACRGAVWHGCAADALARTHGATAVRTTQLLDFLSAALRGA